MPWFLLLATAFPLLSLLSCVGVTPDAGLARAQAHVEALAGTIGRRPHGSPAAAEARGYILDELRKMGFEARVQGVDAVHHARGLTARVRNVIAWRDGDRDEGIALVAHYDSRPESPGAADDALGVATSLEAARRLMDDGPLRYSLFVLITDAEELGLMGARALVTDPEVMRRVRAFLNFEGTGGAGSPTVFQATGGDILRAWASGAAVPDGGSFGAEIYRRMPNDTDFTVLTAAGLPGLNVASIGDAYAYHTDRDVPARVSPATLARNVDNAVAIVRRLDATELESRDEPWTFFDVGGAAAFAYAPIWSSTFTFGSVVLAAVAWVLLGLHGRREVGLGRLVVTTAALLFVATVGAAGVAAAGWVVARARPEATPWYAEPSVFFAFMISTGALAGWAAARLTRRWPDRVRLWRSPSAVWLATLPVWGALTAVSVAVAPGAAYLVAVPLAAAAVGVLVSRQSPAVLRTVSAAVAVLTWMLPVSDGLRLLVFSVPLSGWLPGGLPWFAFAGLILAVCLLALPPMAAVTAGWRTSPLRAKYVALALSIPIVLSGVLSLVVPAYTDGRPERRTAVYVHDQSADDAWWEVGGNEAVVPAAEWPGGPWGPPGNRRPARTPVGVSSRFRIMGTSADRVDPPATVRASLESNADGRRELAIAIVPSSLVAARIVLPAGLIPQASSLVGRVSAGRWTASYAAVPNAGLSVRMAFSSFDPAALADVSVWLTTADVPGGTGSPGVPEWLRSSGATWSLRSVFIVPVRP